MRTLKEQIALDRFVFLNPEEFGEEISIDGVPCLGSWDEKAEQPVRQYFGAGMEDVMGVFTRERVLFFMRADGGSLRTPVPGQELNVDGIRWTVRDAKREAGIIELNLYRNET
jgi:hypothetical protein